MSVFIDKALDLFVSLISTLVIFVITRVSYHFFRKIPIRSYFIKEKHANNRNYFKIGWKPNGIDHFNDFREGGYFAIAWPEVGDLKQYINKPDEEIRAHVRSKLEGIIENETALGQVAGYFVKFLRIKKGDIIVTSREGQLYIYQVKESYFFSEENLKDHTTHRIKIDKNSELHVPTNSPDILQKLKRVAQNRLTIISLNDYSDQIELLLNR